MKFESKILTNPFDRMWNDLSLDGWREQQKEKRENYLRRRRESAFAKKMAPIYAFMNRFSLVFHILLAVVLNFTIESISRHSIFKAYSYLTDTPLTFLYNTYIIFLCFMVVYLTKRRVFARVLIAAGWLVLGVVNGCMLSNRVTPFNAQDLQAWKEGFSLFTNYYSAIEIFFITLGLVSVSIFSISFWRRGGEFQGKIKRIKICIGIAIASMVYGVFTGVAIDNRIISTYFGNIAFAYEDYGFPYCFTTSVFNTGISQPMGYSKEKMDQIVEGRAYTQTSIGGNVLPNIIFVQLESFFDVTKVNFLNTSEDPLPNFRALSEQYSSGNCIVPSVGAGTANTEFEVLTGMNLRFFGPGEYPYKTMLKDNTCESAATALSSLGYGTHALHNNGGNFYSRADVFNNIGFDSFTSKEFMNIMELTENGWAKDKILTKYIIEALDSTKNQDFVFGISVQAHGDYPKDKVIENPRIKVGTMEDEGQKNAWEYYVNQIYQTDIFVGNLVSEMEKRNEPTVLVFYGDHLPTMGLETKDLARGNLFSTDYFVWDNIGLEKDDQSITTYQLVADIMDRIGMHTGTTFNYHQQRKNTKDYLVDMEMLQYDILYGNQFVYNEKPLITEGHMEMGIKDAKLDSIYKRTSGGYVLLGSKFTKSSQIFVNGEKQKVEFKNEKLIFLPELDELEEGDSLTVAQVGSYKRVFRESPNYFFIKGDLVNPLIPDEIESEL